MRLDEYSYEEIEHEYFKRKREKDKQEEYNNKQEENRRIAWLNNHGGTDGNDQCATGDCRIGCTGCD